MRYIVTKRFKTKAACGAVNLPYGTICDTVSGYIINGENVLCAMTSQNAYDFFSRDDDGHGEERGKLVRDIKRQLERRDANYQARWDKLWADDGANKLRRPEHQDFWIWSFDFYNAPIEELQRIQQLLN